jgi:PKD repeat protein
MRMNEAASIRVLAIALCLLPLAGCETGPYKSDFSVVVANRAPNTIEVMANGSALGAVTAGQTSTFTLTLTESNPNILSNGVAPTPRAEVTISARDTRTGIVSPTRSLTLSQGSPTLVEFSTADFPSPVPAPTVARFNLSPTNPGINQAVSFNASASTASNATYTWDFGDMTTGTGVTTTHPYPRPGNFTVTLTVTSDNGNASTASRVVNVSGNLPPVAANFTFSPTAPSINQNVLFTAQMFGPIVLDARYDWNFGDGATGTGSTATHAYTRAGSYAVTLRVTNPGGQAAAATRTVTVSASLPAGSVDFSISPTDPHVTEMVYVNAAASIATAVSYTWDFGDGTTGAGIRNSHVYTVARTYTITLTVRNELGQTGSASKTVTVLD